MSQPNIYKNIPPAEVINQRRPVPHATGQPKATTGKAVAKRERKVCDER